MGWFAKRRARKEEANALRRKAAREAAIDTPCGRAKIAHGGDPLDHCPYPVGYAYSGPCKYGKMCGFTERMLNPDWEPAEEIR